MNPYDQNWIKRARWLTQALIISGTLNIGFLSTFIYFALKEKQRPMEVAPGPQKSPLDPSASLNMQQQLVKYRNYSFQDLMIRLGNADHVEAGYTKRDLALACLVKFHRFNLERALGGITLQRRSIAFTPREGEEKLQLNIFPGLADYQYQAISSYAKTEKWPLTSEGLFFELKSMTPPYEPTLVEAFYLTPEFHFLSTLFSKTGVPLRKESLTLLLIDGKWETVREFATLLAASSEFTKERRREFLLQLIDEHSRLAARLLVRIEEDFAVRGLDDEQTLELLDLLGKKAPESFVKKLLSSPRSDEIWKKASAVSDIPIERAALKEEPAAPKVLKPQKVVSETIHIVVPGDSLWKIARKYKTTIKAIQEKNGLKTDRLRPGQELII